MTSRLRVVRRVECAGSCGRWWYHPSPEHPTKPVRWCERCYRMHKSRMRNLRDDPAPPLGRGPLAAGAPREGGER